MSGWPTALLATCMVWMYATAGFRQRHPREPVANVLSATLVAMVPALIDVAGTQGWRLIIQMDAVLAALLRIR